MPRSGGQHPVGGGLHPHVLRHGQVLLRRVLPPEVPHQLQQAAAAAGRQRQGRLRRRARGPGGEQGRPRRGPDGVPGGGAEEEQGDRLCLFPRDLR